MVTLCDASKFHGLTRQSCNPWESHRQPHPLSNHFSIQFSLLSKPLQLIDKGLSRFRAELEKGLSRFRPFASNCGRTGERTVLFSRVLEKGLSRFRTRCRELLSKVTEQIEKGLSPFCPLASNCGRTGKRTVLFSRVLEKGLSRFRSRCRELLSNVTEQIDKGLSPFCPVLSFSKQLRPNRRKDCPVFAGAGERTVPVSDYFSIQFSLLSKPLQLIDKGLSPFSPFESNCGRTGERTVLFSRVLEKGLSRFRSRCRELLSNVTE
jgi:DNA-directed RNA polymerase subunit L